MIIRTLTKSIAAVLVVLSLYLMYLGFKLDTGYEQFKKEWLVLKENVKPNRVRPLPNVYVPEKFKLRQWLVQHSENEKNEH